MFDCLHVCMFVCLLVCMILCVCLPVSLSGNLFVCLYARSLVWFCFFVFVCPFPCLFVYQLVMYICRLLHFVFFSIEFASMFVCLQFVHLATACLHAVYLLFCIVFCHYNNFSNHRVR